MVLVKYMRSSGLRSIAGFFNMAFSNTSSFNTPNPHLSELKARPGLLNAAGRWIRWLPWVVLAALLWLMLLLANVAVSYQLWVVLLAAAVVLMVGVPFLAAASAARLLSEDLERGHYVALAMTNLSDRALIDGYFFAGLHRVRAAVWLLVLVLAASGLGSLWAGMQSSPNTDVGALLLLWLLLPLQLAGLSGGVAAVGVVLALRYHGQIVSSTAVPLLALALTVGGLLLLVRAVLLSGAAERETWLFWVQLPLLVAAPYVLMSLSLRTARRYARRV